MKVYVVQECFDYEGARIAKIFATRELAEAYCDTVDLGGYPYFTLTITEWEVNDSLEKQ